MQKIVTAIQPSGNLHIGNYLGTLKNWPAYTDQYECIFFIADLHSLTSDFDPRAKTGQILTLAAEILALGVDPAKCILFRQADVLEHTQLAWILSCITPMGYLERMTQYKDKSGDNPDNINAGLLTYPVLQAADILMYEPDLVPVGQDQKQHIELTRDIAGFFNHRFGDTFKSPEHLYTQIPKVMSLADSSKKMSKSHGEKTYIALSDEPEVILEKIKKAVTDEQGLANLKGLAATFMPDRDLSEFEGNNAAFKEALAQAIADHFADFRTKRAKLLANPDQIIQILKEGAEKARALAQPKLREVWRKVGLIG